MLTFVGGCSQDNIIYKCTNLWLSTILKKNPQAQGVDGLATYYITMSVSPTILIHININLSG